MGNVFDLLDDEWRRLSADRGGPRRLRDVCDAAGGAASLADVERYVRAADPAGADAVLLALVRRAVAGDALAARVLLQLLLPGTRALARRWWALGDADERAAAAVTAVYHRIRHYPIERRPGRVAANILLDAAQELRRARPQAAGHPVGRPGGAGRRRPPRVDRPPVRRRASRGRAHRGARRRGGRRASSTGTTPSSSPGRASAASGSPTSPSTAGSAPARCGTAGSAPSSRSSPPGWPADVDGVVVLPPGSAPAGRAPVAVVLSSGANMGAVQVGVLRALVEHGVRPDLIVGCSIGALNGAALAQDPTCRGVARLEEAWTHRRCLVACCPGRGCRRRSP